jgi:hypothetical protein
VGVSIIANGVPALVQSLAGSGLASLIVNG